MTQLNPHNPLQAYGVAPRPGHRADQAVRRQPGSDRERLITTLGAVLFVVALIALDRKQKRNKRIFK